MPALLAPLLSILIKPGLPFLPMALLKKPSLGVALGGEQEIDSIPLVINCPTIVAPLASYFYILLVHPPTITWSFFPFMEGFFQLRCLVNNPSVQCPMINLDTTFSHHLFNVSIAE